MLRLLILGLLATAVAPFAQTNPVHDSTLTWRTYASERAARVRVFHSTDERRPHTVVIDERAANGGVITDEAGFLADLVGRELGFDPTSASFVFRFTPASFAEDADDRGKTLLVRATFGRTSTGALAAPTWRVITSDVLSELTDRALR